MKHIVLTRYNAGNIDEEWNMHRLAIFREYTLPSILSQTCQDFVWVLAVDDDTPMYLSKFIVDLPSNSHVIWVGKDKSWWSYFKEYLGYIDGPIITSQLDSDDAISPHYIQTVQDNVSRYLKKYPDIDKVVFNAPWGLEVNHETKEKRVYAHYTEDDFRPRVSPFFSVYENGNNNVGVYEYEHRDWSKYYPVVHMNSQLPLYTRVIHGKNISNQMEGSLIVSYGNDR